ncbi:matrixin [Haloactinopolyspora alba]|uniref:Matrixin n=1 Tax=Haloactinopolyspora alba TaxID=648780 RepID=A0A2P8D709_9ACTN|nr:matrixin family metalloprotease [Haloactinopolyspora alba]PSK93013.1 matrixin [Haloactinopolyspora alba]
MHAARANRRPHALALLGLVVILALAAFALVYDDRASSAPPVEDYHDQGHWPGPNPTVCVQDETRGFPVTEAAAEFAGTPVRFVVETDCSGYGNVVQVEPDINPDSTAAGWFRAQRDDDGYYESAMIWLNVDQAFRLDPHAWRMILVHELGHAAGLSHTDGHGSVMDPVDTSDADGLTDADRAQLDELYAR